LGQTISSFVATNFAVAVGSVMEVTALKVKAALIPSRLCAEQGKLSPAIYFAF
jgi:hypothetical protein